MSTGVESVPATLPAADAWELMRRRRIHHLVVAHGRKILGVLSDRDAGGRAGATVRAEKTVGELMTGDPVTVAPTDTIRRAANLMRGRTIGCLPVTDRDRIVGIVTTSDLLEVLGRGVDRPAQPARRGLHHRVPHRKQTRPTGTW